MDQSRRPLTSEDAGSVQASTCRISSKQSGTGTGLSPSTSAFPCQYRSTIAPYWHFNAARIRRTSGRRLCTMKRRWAISSFQFRRLQMNKNVDNDRETNKQTNSATESWTLKQNPLPTASSTNKSPSKPLYQLFLLRT